MAKNFGKILLGLTAAGAAGAGALDSALRRFKRNCAKAGIQQV